ncbi:RNA methyltransferase [Aquiluna borgnonia]|uniref:RNA methyltransferase n=1 Tax=Aquiluna borgnonia TaxID=2499157 RepID=A0A7D4TJ77_9MICO|nr:RNA methyltransferase [Aquiluna borgnonia]QKJ25431.1 RNA methyltransferase [Aquiluna borgnonia]
MLDDPKSARVKGVAALQQKDARFETGLFLLEGPQGLKELARDPSLAREVFATEAALERYDAEFVKLGSAEVPVVVTSQRAMEKLSDTKTPQGVVAVVGQLDVELSDLIDSSPRLIAILDRVQDPGNAGTVLRAADAAGADGVIFSRDCVDLYNPKVVRATAGSILHVPCVIEAESRAVVLSLQASGVQVFAASAGGKSILSSELDLTRPTAWIFGNEAQGVSQELLELVDEVVALPIYGEAESLNLATAASVCLYASAFKLQANH